MNVAGTSTGDWGRSCLGEPFSRLNRTAGTGLVLKDLRDTRLHFRKLRVCLSLGDSALIYTLVNCYSLSELEAPS
jgi:hypothetical protein